MSLSYHLYGTVVWCDDVSTEASPGLTLRRISILLSQVKSISVADRIDEKGREVPNGSRMIGWDDGSKANVPSGAKLTELAT